MVEGASTLPRGLADGELAIELQSAIDRFWSDHRYEDVSTNELHGRRPTVLSTLRALEVVSTASTKLVEAIGSLSPVGVLAISEAMQIRWMREDSRNGGGGHVRLKRPFGRLEIERAVNAARRLIQPAALAVSILRERHRPFADTGQGTGSSAGKDSDLRVVEYHPDYPSVPFKSPKDKFAVRVIEALMRHNHPLSNIDRPLREARLLLDSLWIAAGNSKPANWERVLKSRKHIAAKMAPEVKARAWRQARYETSPKNPKNRPDPKS